MSASQSRFSRRGFLTGAAATAAAAGLWARSGVAAEEPVLSSPLDRRLLFVVGASGGASLVDSFLPVGRDEVPASADPESLNVYAPDQLFRPDGSRIRCVRPLEETNFLTPGYGMQSFLESHYEHMTVVAHEVTSVNHLVAQKRSVTGAGVNRGRTISEAVAERHGADLPLANCNMAQGGFVEPGEDLSLPAYARGEVIAAPSLYALSTHGSRGVAGGLSTEALARARGVRSGLDDASPFGQTYRNNAARANYLSNREDVSLRLEQSDAIRNLMLLNPSELDPSLGIEASPLSDAVRNVYPQLDSDTWQQQGALSFLLAYYGLSCASTMSLSFNPSFDGDDIVGAPLAFNFSHNDHRSTQNVMWGRVLRTVDGLVRLLQSFDYLGDPSLGSMWERSVIYVATDFGRDKVRPSGEEYYGTGHDLNNGSLLLSPLMKGNRVFGGVDPSSLLTHGFDPKTGEEKLDSVAREPEVYSLIAQAMDVEFDGRRDMSGLLK